MTDAKTGISLAEQLGSYISEKDDRHACMYYGFDVEFDNSVCLETNRTYEIISRVNGPLSWFGEIGQQTVEIQEIRFSFSNSAASISGTSVSRGQFPAFLFSPW